MQQKRTIDAVISKIRLGWHAFAFAGLGVASGLALHYSADDMALPFIAGIPMIGIGAVSYLHSLKSYLRTKRSIRTYGSLDRRVVEQQLQWYCNRQGARTATVEYGLENEFDRIMDENKDDKLLDFVPHI